jgi:hypothetical protein
MLALYTVYEESVQYIINDLHKYGIATHTPLPSLFTVLLLFFLFGLQRNCDL